ncbi:MAG: flavin reductase family protein [Hyphomicrobiaceae bacterium]|nr:flavin reductase family protein [Hyphomicrobiaceae bacterium]
MIPLALPEVYKLIEPGPVVLLATRARTGRANVMTMSWHMMTEFAPPSVACVVSSANHSFKALRSTGECVIAIPSVAMAETVVAVGNCSGRSGDKLAMLGLATAEASLVRAPLLPQCLANLECRVTDMTLVERMNLFVLEVVAAWIDPRQRRAKTIHHCGYGAFIVDGRRISLPSAKA